MVDPGRLLEVSALEAGYGDIPVLRDVSLHVGSGEVVAVLGANGAGKTTLLRSLSGVIRPTGGSVRLEGTDVTGWRPDQRLGAGLVLVPEGREVFDGLTVEENLRIGGFTRSAQDLAEDLASMYDRFEVLKNRRQQAAGTLSGGEQQQLAIARALMARPTILLLDEPSLGLAPVLVRRVFDLIADLKQEGLTMVLVEQNTARALEIADRVYVQQVGRIVFEGTPEEIGGDDRLGAVYLGEDDARSG